MLSSASLLGARKSRRAAIASMRSGSKGSSVAEAGLVLTRRGLPPELQPLETKTGGVWCGLRAGTPGGLIAESSERSNLAARSARHRALLGRWLSHKQLGVGCQGVPLGAGEPHLR